MKINKVKKKFILIIVIFVLMYFKINVFAYELEKGIYHITNPINGTNMYVNEKGKPLLVDNSNNTTIDEIRDIFTKEIIYVYKEFSLVGKRKAILDYHDKEYYDEDDLENDLNEEHYKEDSEYDYVDYNDVYYYDENLGDMVLNDSKIIDGPKINNIYINKYGIDVSNIFLNAGEVCCAFSSVILFENLVYYDTNINMYKELTEITNENEVKKYDSFSVETFYDYLFIYTYSDSGYNIYVYDKNMNFIKKFKNQPLNVISDINKNQYLKIYNDKNNLYIYYDKKFNEISQIDENDLTNFNELKNISEEMTFEVDNIKRTTKLDNGVIINDLVSNKGIKIKIDNKKYYYFLIEDYAILYDERGIKFKIFYNQNNVSFEVYKNFILGKGVNNEKYLYTIDFRSIDSGNVIKSIFDGKYYYIENKTKNYNNKTVYEFTIYKADEYGSFDFYDLEPVSHTHGRMVGIYDDKYLVTRNDNEIIVYDSDIEQIKYLSGNQFSEVHIGNKKYYSINEANNYKIISDDFQNILYDGIYSIPFISNKYMLILKNNEYILLDENLDEVKKIKNNKNIYIPFVTDEYIVIYGENDLYNFYNIKTNKIILRLKYVGKKTDKYFTFQNGFNYGFMDNDLNVIFSYSVFDNFNDMNYDYDY